MRGRDGAATKARIEREALRLFAAKGVDGTSVRDIAEAVGVADAALYRHFASKEEIGRAIFATHYGALARAIALIGAGEASFAAKIRALVEMFCALFDSQPEAFAFILIQQHAHLRFMPDGGDVNAVSALVRIMAEGFARGDMAIDDAELAAAMALGAVVQPAVFRLYGRLPGTMMGRVEVLAGAALRILGAG